MSRTRARARLEGRAYCAWPREADGRPCRRLAGSGTTHPGVGPCADHDDGSFELPAFAENVEARSAFLNAVRDFPKAGIRELVEPLGYARRDVTALVESDPVFAEEYAVARGYDVDSLRTAVHQRAVDGSDRLLEFEAKMRLPEAQVLQRRWLDGRLEVQPRPMYDPEKLSLEEKRELFRLLEKARPDAHELPEDGAPAAELLRGSEEV